MNHFYRSGFVLGCLLMAVTAGLVTPPPSPAEEIQIEIDVAPNVINIQSESSVVTVHTNIPYAKVEGESVSLNDVPIYFWKSDARGYFVAKFGSDEIKELFTLDETGDFVIGDENRLTLTGETTDGYAFIGSQDILVIDNIPQGGN